MSKPKEKLGGKRLFDAKPADSPTKQNISQPSTTMGRPKTMADVEKTTITMNRSSIYYLDDTSTAIRRNTKKIVDRGALVRGIVSAIQSSKLDLTKCESESAVTEHVLAKLKSGD